MPKFFVISDVHGFYNEMRAALDAAGFDENNEDHWIITCGDNFDRGPNPTKVMMYLKSLPRKILVRGNHEQLLTECCKRGEASMYDYSNGTYNTICEIGDAGMGYSFSECCETTLSKTRMFLNSMVNYFETKNYIFVHSWIPTVTGCKKGASKPWHQSGKYYEYKEDWRDSTDLEWEEAMWGNPFFKAQDGMNKTGKTIVFGHWHCSLGHLMDSDGELSEFGADACWDIYHNEELKVVGIDKCTAHTRAVNVFVLEDEFIE